MTEDKTGMSGANLGLSQSMHSHRPLALQPSATGPTQLTTARYYAIPNKCGLLRTPPPY